MYQVMEMPNRGFVFRQGAEFVSVTSQALLHAVTKLKILRGDLTVYSAIEVTKRAHLPAAIGVAVNQGSDFRTLRAERKDLEEIHTVRIDVDSEIGRHGKEHPTFGALAGQV
mgnify:CR=1 FL=1